MNQAVLETGIASWLSELYYDSLPCKTFRKKVVVLGFSVVRHDEGFIIAPTMSTSTGKISRRKLFRHHQGLRSSADYRLIEKKDFIDNGIYEFLDEHLDEEEDEDNEILISLEFGIYHKLPGLHLLKEQRSRHAVKAWFWIQKHPHQCYTDFDLVIKGATFTVLKNTPVALP